MRLMRRWITTRPPRAPASMYVVSRGEEEGFAFVAGNISTYVFFQRGVRPTYCRYGVIIEFLNIGRHTL